MEVKIVNKSLNPDPFYATEGSVGVDLYADLVEPLILREGIVEKIPTGVFLEMPNSIEGQIRPRSSMGLKGVVIPNSPGTIDSDYRGEVCVLLVSLLGKHIIMPGQKIAQLVFTPVVKPSLIKMQPGELSATQRDDGGFGSTGKF